VPLAGHVGQGKKRCCVHWLGSFKDSAEEHRFCSRRKASSAVSFGLVQTVAATFLCRPTCALMCVGEPQLSSRWDGSHFPALGSAAADFRPQRVTALRHVSSLTAAGLGSRGFYKAVPA
jgi:hypothetical protein